MSKNYYKDVCYIFVVNDLTNQKSFDSVEYWFKEINKINAGASLVVNKWNLYNERKIVQNKGKKKASSFNSVFHEDLAAQKINIVIIFLDLMNLVYQV